MRPTTYITAASHRFVAILAFGIATLYLTGCSGKINDTLRKDVLDSLAYKVIIPAFQDLNQEAVLLKQTVEKFVDQPTSEHLDEARAQWRRTAGAWKRASNYTFGPIEDQFLSGGIYYASVHESNIEKTIRSSEDFDESSINAVGSSLKGLRAVEYLLFKSESPEQLLADYKQEPRRGRYLLALVQNLNRQTEKVLELWTAGSAPYVQTFTTAAGRELNSSLSIVVNKCIQQINFIRDERLGMPMRAKQDQSPRPDLVEGTLSNTSLYLLRNELQSVHNCFQKGGAPLLNALLDDMNATYDGQALSTKINDQFETIYQSIETLPSGLENTIVTNRNEIEKLYDQMKRLQILLEVDVVNHLGIILTFSDNDGD